jgi:glycosyltransferase involved in cell wall biosynthesis
VIATDTPGQRTLEDATRGGIWWYRPGDVARLAEGLRHWHDDRAALLRARELCFAAARDRFHWEHELESGALIAAARSVLASCTDCASR